MLKNYVSQDYAKNFPVSVFNAIIVEKQAQMFLSYWTGGWGIPNSEDHRGWQTDASWEDCASSESSCEEEWETWVHGGSQHTTSWGDQEKGQVSKKWDSAKIILLP